MRNLGIWSAYWIFTKKYVRIRGPEQFKPVLFKVQLYKETIRKIQIIGHSTGLIKSQYVMNKE